MTHAWCQDPARDAAVRAAEDGRDRPLPTLGECIDRQWQAPTARPCGGTDTAPLGGEPSGSVNGMRTERITLEVTGSPGWRVHVNGIDIESVRVVEEPYFDDLCQVAMERDAAIRERDKLQGRVAELEAASGGGEGEAAQWAVMYPTGRLGSSFDTKEQAESVARNQGFYELTVVPLYRQPPQPRGWLTASDRQNLEEIVVCLDDDDWHHSAAFVRSLLARSSPPEVVLPTVFSRSILGGRLLVEAQVKDALAAAGVAVKEVGK